MLDSVWLGCTTHFGWKVWLEKANKLLIFLIVTKIVCRLSQGPASLFDLIYKRRTRSWYGVLCADFTSKLMLADLVGQCMA